jgi:hypothetical protein
MNMRDKRRGRYATPAYRPGTLALSRLLAGVRAGRRQMLAMHDNAAVLVAQLSRGLPRRAAREVRKMVKADLAAIRRHRRWVALAEERIAAELLGGDCSSQVRKGVDKAPVIHKIDFAK